MKKINKLDYSINKYKNIFCPVFILIIFLSVRAELKSQQTADNCLRILDINIWSGLNYEGFLKMGEYETPEVREIRYHGLVKQIKQLEPDIIGIHEANKLPDYAIRLADDIGYEVFYHVGVGGVRFGPIGLPWNLREGDAILVKTHLNPQFAGRKQLSGGYVGKWFTFHFSDATQIIGIKIIHKGKPIFVFATHWHSSVSDEPCILMKIKELRDSGSIKDEVYEDLHLRIKEGVDWRLVEARKTIEFIKGTARDNFYILMGDFNSESGSQEIRELIKHGMIDVFRNANPDSSGFTWDPGTNLNIRTHYLTDSQAETDEYAKLEKFYTSVPRRIDYIFMGPAFALNSNAVSIKSSKVVMKDVINGLHTSDHYGIFTEIQINH